MAEVHVRAWQDGYAGLMPQAYLDGLSNQLDRRTEFWASLEQTETLRTWVGSLDGELVGIATAGPDQAAEGCGELWMLNVVAAAWGTGVGQSLLEEATEHLRAAVGPSAVLWVLDTNARARRFYERNGWEPDGATKVDTDPGIPLTEVRYRRAV